jgi:hypothetical protein
MFLLKLLCIAFAFGLIASCGNLVPGNNASSRRQSLELSRDDQIRFVVLDFVLTEWGGNDSDYEHFVSVAESDPSQELLNSLNVRWKRLRPFSESYVDQSKGSGGGVKDKVSDKRGVLWKVSEIKVLDTSTVDVTAGYYSSGLGAAVCKFRLRLEVEQWAIILKQSCQSS